MQVEGRPGAGVATGSGIHYTKERERGSRKEKLAPSWGRINSFRFGSLKACHGVGPAPKSIPCQ